MPRGTRIRKQHKSLKPYVILVGAFVLVTLFAVLPVFHIRQIVVKNNLTIPSSTILQYSGLKENQHFLRKMGGTFSDWLQLRYASVEQNLLANISKLADVEVRFVFPSTIEMTISERIPVAFLKIPDGYLLLDRDEIAIAVEKDQPQGLPVIEGIQITSMELGQAIETANATDLTEAIKVVSALVEAELKDPEYLLLSSVQNVKTLTDQKVSLSIEYEGRRYQVLCRQNPYLVDHFLWLKKILSQADFRQRGDGVFDLTGKNQYFKSQEVIG